MDDELSFLRLQAERCRRLAAGVFQDPAAAALLAMAEEHEARAMLLEAGQRAAPEPGTA